MTCHNDNDTDTDNDNDNVAQYLMSLSVSAGLRTRAVRAHPDTRLWVLTSSDVSLRGHRGHELS